MNIWRCLSRDENDEYNEDQDDIMEQIRQLQHQVDQLKNAMEIQRGEYSTNDEQLRNSLEKFLELLVEFFSSRKNKNKLENLSLD